MKKTLSTEIVPIILIVVSFVLAVFFYAHFPALVPIHWDVSGHVNRYGSKAFAAFFFPCIITLIYLLFLALPYIDPRKNRYVEFAKTYHIFKTSIVVLMFVIYIVASLSAMGYGISIEKVVPTLIGLLFIIIGNYFGKIKSNFMMGIRTPWTLSNEDVWNKTHRLGGKLFVIGGILMVLSSLLPAGANITVLITVVAIIAIVPVVYSYVIYTKIPH